MRTAPLGAWLAAARSWVDAESLMLELTGTALDINYLEVVVPVFRTGHLFVDRDGRQVGEANVFPMTARIEVQTDWRGCPYAGNRYQTEKPMNVTALRAMRQHWRPMMAMLMQIREAYLSRFPDARAGWTVGHVERLSTAVLALPSYLMLRGDAGVANGNLHPALSNLFRVTDGLRMVMHQMLFLPVMETMRAPDAPVSAAEVLAYADRNYSFHSDHGVCAGPRFMIEDFLGVILDGAGNQSQVGCMRIEQAQGLRAPRRALRVVGAIAEELLEQRLRPQHRQHAGAGLLLPDRHCVQPGHQGALELHLPEDKLQKVQTLGDLADVVAEVRAGN